MTPRKTISLEDEAGRRMVSLVMAHGLSVRFTVDPSGETTLFVEPHNEKVDPLERAGASSIVVCGKPAVLVPTTEQPKPLQPPAPTPQPQQSAPPSQQGTPRRGPGRPRKYPRVEKGPVTFDDFKES